MYASPVCNLKLSGNKPKYILNLRTIKNKDITLDSPEIIELKTEIRELIE
ncbi:MAG: hypothetical protein KOO66_07035 [Bacteroidales bacterium]|nr:hypothetical protein [Bacteroidales bacterium]